MSEHSRNRFGIYRQKQVMVWILFAIPAIFIGPQGWTARGSGRQSESKPAASSLPLEAGWHEVPNTQLAAVCPNYPDIEGNTGCAAVTAAWNGGIADTRRNRLVFWGGGHSDYFGNELYALNLTADPITLVRLNEPTRNPDVRGCPDAFYDGKPSSRHTYNGLAYIADADRMFLFSGAKSICGYGGDDTWTLDLESLQWKRQDPVKGGPIGSCDGCVAAYDPKSRRVYVATTSALWGYDYAANTYSSLNPNASTDYHLTGVIDEKREMLFEFGAGQLKAFSIAPKSKYAIQAWDKQVQGCDALVRAAYPGLAYDTKLDRIVGWAGGDSVYLFDTDKRACTQVTFPNGPGPQMGNGTHGRFRYFPGLDVFALVNNWKQNAFILRLPPVS